MQNTALKILKTGNNLFLTGSAGTGKTYILNEFVFYLKSRKIIPTIVAPTGIAASHLQGQTIHSYFSLGIRSEIDDSFVENLLEKKYLQSRFSKLKVLIIDEISMVSPEVFSSIDKILKAFKQNQKPFGGVQTILSGDFFQLPPISRVPTQKRFAWQADAWRELELKTIYLEDKFRQDDDVLISILDDIRSGEISEGSYEYLQSRHHKELDIGYTPTKLYTHNIDVDRINNDELDKIHNKLHTFEYTSEGNATNIEKIFKSSLVQEKVYLKKDAVVMFIKNNHELGYVNGTTGVVVDFDKETKLPIVKTSEGFKIKVPREDWSMENENSSVVAKVSQIPLKLAWAITIHKSQGMTLDSAEIDLSRTFEVGQGYVALSRIKNIEGLRLMGLNDNALRVDELILRIDDRIKAASQRATDEIESVPQEQLQNLFDAYMLSIDGMVDTQEISKEEQNLKALKVVASSTPTHLQTKELFASCGSLEEIAKMRAVSCGTIIKHLGILKEIDPQEDLSKFMPDTQTLARVKEVHERVLQRNNPEDFNEAKKMKLKPIHEELDGEMDYDAIRLALIGLGI